eukprot:CAMPEP_0194388462 /NCGR_PEP_ID=MMETSP0174-20130528/98621_1 /TAXON_ID=216777 /ORGANISM="Proboscia alata, Strain PI-D3" /LENGTH=230 /DNA_ID=CAMNT_0039179753 /DNA_START=65 /DNA_END=757 /DNA_ORIENTATION=-
MSVTALQCKVLLLLIMLQITVELSLPSPASPSNVCDRRVAFLKIVGGSCLLSSSSFHQSASARAPGSDDVTEAVAQIRDAALDLRQLQKDWDLYAVVTSEGRAGNNTAGARRILGGIAPQAGDAAIEVAKVTPLYRIDGAFTAIRKAAIDAEDKTSWEFRLDFAAFDEIAERVLFEIQKADGDFYGVNFASKGTTQLSGIYNEARAEVDKGSVDLEEMVRLLTIAGAPGL